jgi:hypothetical protein
LLQPFTYNLPAKAGAATKNLAEKEVFRLHRLRLRNIALEKHTLGQTVAMTKLLFG